MAKSAAKKSAGKRGRPSGSTAAKKQSNGMIGNGRSANTGLKEVFVTELKDIFSAEKQLLNALPEMAEACYTEELQDAIMNHYQETERQVRRLEKIFNRLGIEAKEEESCKAMEGLIEEGKKIIKEFEEGVIRDTLLIIGSQKIEHYEIATYGSLRDIAEVMGMEQIADMLDRTLEEEEMTDMVLTEIADYVNESAERESSEYSY